MPSEVYQGVVVLVSALACLVLALLPPDPTSTAILFAQQPSLRLSRFSGGGARDRQMSVSLPPGGTTWLPPRGSPYEPPEDFATHSQAFYRRLKRERDKIRAYRQDQRDEFVRKTRAAREQINALKKSSASRMVDIGYYKGKAPEAMSEESFYHARAQETAGEAQRAHQAAAAAAKAAGLAHEKELEAIAAKDAALQKEMDLDDRLQKEYYAAEERAKAQAKEMEDVVSNTYARQL